MNLDQAPGRSRLDAALADLAITFRGMTARPDEHNCECHWGSAKELAQLKLPDVELDPDLLRRTWGASDWDDHASVLRRILPQLATALVNGLVETYFGLGEVGRSFAQGKWQQWSAEQAAAVREFLEAWWVHSLTDPDPAVPAYEDDLLGDELPWDALVDKEDKLAGLTAWLVRHAPARLRAHGASEEVLHRIRLLGLSGHTRWDDPHWPN